MKAMILTKNKNIIKNKITDRNLLHDDFGCGCMGIYIKT